jgi:hypothetical protein
MLLARPERPTAPLITPSCNKHPLLHLCGSTGRYGAPITLVLATLAHADVKTTNFYAHARPGVANVGAVADTTRRTIASDAKEALFGDLLKQQLRMGPDPDDPVRLFSRSQ